MHTQLQWPQQACEIGRELGFDLVGVASVEPSARLAMFPDWIEAGKAGAMDYLARRGADGRYLRERIRAAWPWARSVLCAAVVYNAPQPRSVDFAGDRERGWISRYAWGEDYHDVLRAKLEAWIERLRAELDAGEHLAAAWRSPERQRADPAGNRSPHSKRPTGATRAKSGEPLKATVDTAPLVERDAAWRAGLGWLGKNTCLIHPHQGSYFFLGTVVTSLELAEADDVPLPDRCGACTRCLDACPTHCLTPYEMDASRCLAYLNIELRGSIPAELRTAMGKNVLGCDICQDVCPWNRRAAVTGQPEFQPRAEMVAPRLEALAAMDEQTYRARFRHSAVKRAKFSGLQRNTAIAMGNSGNPAFLPRLQAWQAGADPVLAEHAAWAIQRIKNGGTNASH